MSRSYDAKQQALMAHPTNREAAVDLFLGYVDMSESDFEYEFSMTPEEYIFGKEPTAQGDSE